MKEEEQKEEVDEKMTNIHFKTAYDPTILGQTLCMCAKSLQLCLTLCDPTDYSSPTRLLCPWDSPGKNTGVGCHALVQGIFPTQGSNLRLLCLLHWSLQRQVLYHQRHLGSSSWALLRFYVLQKEMAIHSSTLAWKIPYTPSDKNLYVQTLYV